jgi:hypothetical protein
MSVFTELNAAQASAWLENYALGSLVTMPG